MMVDVENLASAPSADDFVFRVGPGGDPASWASAPAPTIALRAGAGVGNSDRITFIWQDGQIVNQWLQVTALSDANGGGLGLEADDVFYFGNLAGDFDADRTVDDDDARRILHHYRMADVAVADGDIDANNRVNLGDIRRLRDSFGLSLAEFTAPAPAEPDVITQADEALTEPATPITTIGDPGAVEPAEPVLAPRVAPASAATVDSLAALPDGLLASALEADDLATSPEPIEHADLAIRMARTWSAPRLSAPPAPQVTPPEAITEPDVETATHSRDVQPPARDASVVVDLLEQLEVLEPPVGPSL
jgi:hypothetical protein